jgi:hypothetical protein
MNAFGGFIMRLLGNLIEMPVVFVEEVINGDPIAAILIAFGSLFVLGAVGAFGYVVLGALGVPLPNLGRGSSEPVE